MSPPPSEYPQPGGEPTSRVTVRFAPATPFDEVEAFDNVWPLKVTSPKRLAGNVPVRVRVATKSSSLTENVTA